MKQKLKRIRRLPDALARDIGQAAAQWYTDESTSESNVGAMLLIEMTILLGSLTSQVVNVFSSGATRNAVRLVREACVDLAALAVVLHERMEEEKGADA